MAVSIRKHFCCRAVLAISPAGELRQTISHEEAHRKAEALLKKMTVDEKVGQMNQSSGVVMPMLGNEKPDESDCAGQGGVGSVADRREGDQPAAAHRGGEVAAAYSNHVCLRCDSRIPDGISGAAGDGVVVGSESGRAGAAPGGAGCAGGRDSAGPSRRWWTLRGMRGGDGLWKARAKILI